MKKLALLGSGENSVLNEIVKYFEAKDVEISILSDNEHSDFYLKAKEAGLKVKYLPSEKTFEYFSSHDFNLIALCDYRGELCADVLETGRFITIHPSLLPAFRGKDAMERAFMSGVKVSGVTVYSLNANENDERIIAQYPVLISNETHFDEFKSDIYHLEAVLYPVVIDKLLKDEVFDFPDLMNGCSCGGGCCDCH